jgi:hypothetical protein
MGERDEGHAEALSHWARLLHDEYGYGEAASDLRTAADHIADLEAKLAEADLLYIAVRSYWMAQDAGRW